MALVDESGIDVCSEEVLLHALLEVCTPLGESRRLQACSTGPRGSPPCTCTAP